MTDYEQKRIFAKNLNAILEINHLSQREVADRIGVSPQTFNTWCRGIAIPRMDKIQKLADCFHVKKSELIDPHHQSSSSALTAKERALLADFRQLNDDGQDKVCEYTSDLVASGRYDVYAGDGSGSGQSEDETA